MKRIDKILSHELYKKYTEQTNEYEKERIYCRHNMEHFLAVARIAQILNLKKKLKIKKAYVYAAALLHDIGRFRQYEDGTAHDKVSAGLAPQILSDCGFDEQETDRIVAAIRNHRNADVQFEESLSGIIYRADKLSRGCFACPVEPQCDRKAEKKNLKLRF
ncbi:MAG: HD domain-containing protein [Lachnospiraceae bacterium]|nr:HD domain-containing protein [Lachnospiraceae bacterium]